MLIINLSSNNFGFLYVDCLGEGEAATSKMNVDDENSETPANNSEDQVSGLSFPILFNWPIVTT